MISNQPSDVLAYLFNFLDIENIIRLRDVSKLFLHIISNKCIPVHFQINSLEQGLQLISMFKKVTFDISWDNTFDDNGLQKIAKNITCLDLWLNSMITNKGIQPLVNLTFLTLYNNNNITDDGIRTLVNLTFLNLSDNNNITDEGIQYLTNLTSLYLSMYNIKITDKCIQELTSKGIKVIRY